MDKINDQILESLYRESDFYIPKGDAKDSAPIKAVDLMSRKDSLKDIGIHVTNEKGIMIFMEYKENEKNTLIAETINREDFLENYKKPDAMIRQEKLITDLIERQIAKREPHPFYTLANQSKQKNAQKSRVDNKRKQGF